MREYSELRSFLTLESRIRLENQAKTEMKALDPFWSDLIDVLRWYSLQKRNTGEQRKDVPPPQSIYSVLLRDILKMGSIPIRPLSVG
jgi:hypothetical protein